MQEFHFSGYLSEYFYHLDLHLTAGEDFMPDAEDLMHVDELRLQAEETLIYRNLEDHQRFENTLCGCIQENIEVVAIYNIDFSGAENEFLQLILEVVQTRALKLSFVNCVIPQIPLRKKKQVKLGPVAHLKLRLLYSLGLVNCKFIGNRGESIVNL